MKDRLGAPKSEPKSEEDSAGIVSGCADDSLSSTKGEKPVQDAAGILDRLCSITSRKRDPEARRNAILNAAVDLIVESGTSSLTHRAVAARAGVSLGSTTKYFASIEELRESALNVLIMEMEEEVKAFESGLAACDDVENYCVELVYEYLCDVRQVRADIALLNAGTREERLRDVALRYPDKLIEVLSSHFGTERALALELCLEGAAIHSALRSEPVDKGVITRIFQVLISAPWPEEAEGETADLTSGGNRMGKRQEASEQVARFDEGETTHLDMNAIRLDTDDEKGNE